jgi:HlyD family secretion protein
MQLRPTVPEPTKAPATPKPAKARAAKRKSWLRPAILGVIAVALIAWLVVPRFLGAVTPAYPVVRQDVVQTVVASGQVQSPNRIEIGTQINGIVVEIPVAEGQHVGRGEVLIRLDDTEARAAVELAAGQLAQAEARLAQLRMVQLPQAQQTLEQANATLRNADAAFARAERLRRDGIATQVALDEARRNRDVALAQVRAAEVMVQTYSPGGRDEVLAATQVAQAQASLEAARTRLGYTVIRAPGEGTLISRAVERGWVVQTGRTLMTLSPAGAIQIVVQIDERNLGLIALGQTALASADAYPNQTFVARVAFINPAVDPQRGSVQVKLDVPEPPAYLRQDMTVSVDIEVARHPQALVIPGDAVRNSGSSTPWVMKIVDGRAVRQPVKVGIRGTTGVEITEGLAAGDVVVPATAQTTIGQRIRPRIDKGASP